MKKKQQTNTNRIQFHRNVIPLFGYDNDDGDDDDNEEDDYDEDDDNYDTEDEG